MIKLNFHSQPKTQEPIIEEIFPTGQVTLIKKKPTTHFILNGDRENVFPLRCGTRQGVHSHHSYLTLCRKPIEVHKISKIHTDWKSYNEKEHINMKLIISILTTCLQYFELKYVIQCD